MDNRDIQRINELAHIKKQRGLTAEEQSERDTLYKEYIAQMKASLASHLQNVEILEPDGTIHPLGKPAGPVN